MYHHKVTNGAWRPATDIRSLHSIRRTDTHRFHSQGPDSQTIRSHPNMLFMLSILSCDHQRSHAHNASSKTSYSYSLCITPAIVDNSHPLITKRYSKRCIYILSAYGHTLTLAYRSLMAWFHRVWRNLRLLWQSGFVCSKYLINCPFLT